MHQGGQAIRGPSTAVEGGTIEIEVGSNIKDVEINLGGPNDTYSVHVSGSKATIPIPPGAGPWITVSVGNGLNRKFIRIEIISTNP